MKQMILLCAVATTSILAATPTLAGGLDETLEVVPHVFNVHHTKRVLVCLDDDDDCYFVRIPRGGYRYFSGDDDDDDSYWRAYRSYRYYNDDDDDDYDDDD